MDIFERVYNELDALPKHERIQLLRDILPPQELFARTDGTRFIIRKHGLRLFETSALLTQAGIPEDDPRTEVFRELRGGLVDRRIPDALRALAAKSDTVCKRNGAIQVWEGGRKAWWVPLSATSNFEGEVNSLICKFEMKRNELLLDDYQKLRSDAQFRWQESSLAAWENMEQLGKASIVKEDYLRRSMATFEEVFPSQEDIVEKIKIRLVPVQKPLPEKIEKILCDIREAEHKKLQIETEAVGEQMRLVAVTRQLKQAEISRLEDERKVRKSILESALSPEIERAKEIIVQAQASLMRISGEIFRAVESGAEISPATMRSWNKRLNTLSIFAVGNVSLEQALDELKKLKEEPKKNCTPTPSQLENVSIHLETAFRDLEKRAALEIHADKIWQLMRVGRGSDALHRIASLRDEASNRLNEVEALWKLVASVAAENELLGDEESDQEMLIPIEENINA